MPANIGAGQAAKFAESLVRGEPNRAKIALTGLEDKIKELARALITEPSSDAGIQYKR